MIIFVAAKLKDKSTKHHSANRFNEYTPFKPTTGLGTFSRFDLKNIFKTVIFDGNELLRADDSRIRKTACSVSKAVDSIDSKLFFLLFFHQGFSNDLALTDFRAVHRTGFINIPLIAFQPFFGIHYAEFLEAKIKK